MDIAERKGSDLRRRLDSAERLREAAIALPLAFLKTPGSRSKALEVRSTSADQRRVAVPGRRCARPARALELRCLPDRAGALGEGLARLIVVQRAWSRHVARSFEADMRGDRIGRRSNRSTSPRQRTRLQSASTLGG